MHILDHVDAASLRTDIPDFRPGDTVKVHVNIVEGTRSRIQVFQGTLISRKGRGINEMITVRRIVDGQGVERVLPLHSPRLAKIEVVRSADSRRAKLFYLRERTGKKRRLRDRRRGMQHVEGMSTVH